MPIVERDPWRMQYFERVACPDEVFVPTEDGDAYRLFPKQRWVYNKLLVAESQDLECGLHGIEPGSFPVFSKPVYNMRGMGAGSRILRTPREYQLNQKPGHMWMELLKGEHVSTDVAVVDGEPKWWRHVIGKAIDEGMFECPRSGRRSGSARGSIWPCLRSCSRCRSCSCRSSRSSTCSRMARST
jgi:hypothetical protein